MERRGNNFTRRLGFLCDLFLGMEDCRGLKRIKLKERLRRKKGNND